MSHYTSPSPPTEEFGRRRGSGDYPAASAASEHLTRPQNHLGHGNDFTKEIVWPAALPSLEARQTNLTCYQRYHISHGHLHHSDTATMPESSQRGHWHTHTTGDTQTLARAERQRGGGGWKSLSALSTRREPADMMTLCPSCHIYPLTVAQQLFRTHF